MDPGKPDARGSARRSWHRGTLLLALIEVLVLAAGLLVHDHCPRVRSFHRHRVVRLTAGQFSQRTLPFAGLLDPVAIAVDSAANVYVTGFFRDLRPNLVVELAPVSGVQQILPFTGLGLAKGLAVDSADSVYVTDSVNIGL